MDLGRLAISRALQDQNLAPFLERQCTGNKMPDPESQAVLTWILNFHRTHHAVPSPTLVEQQFPNYGLRYAPDPCSYYVEEILKQYVRVSGVELLLKEGKKLTGDDPFAVVTQLRSGLNHLLTLSQVRTEKKASEGTDERWKRYEDRKNNVGLIGIPTPWSSLDDLTQGWQPEMYFGVAGRPGDGKTWLMLWIAHAAAEAGYKVLFVNKELPTEMMDRRYDAIKFKLPYEKLRSGDLTTADEQRYKDGLENDQCPGEIIWLHGAATVSVIAAKTDEHDPDLILIDGAYLLIDEENGRQEWERQKNISRGLKRLAQDYKKPVGISIQLSRSGDTKKNKTVVTLSDVAGSDAYAQDVDILVGIERTDDMIAQDQMRLLPLKSREAPKTPIMISWEFDPMNTEDLGITTKIVANPDDDEDLLDFE